MKWLFLCCFFILISRPVFAQENNEASKEGALPDTKQATAEALAQALSRSVSSKLYLLDQSEKMKQKVQSDSIDKRGALKSLSSVDALLLSMEIDFFTLIAHQAHMESTAALGGAGQKDKETSKGDKQ